MKFLIRDDDPCGFTTPEELEHCYKDIWGHVPVNFSVTPFRIPGNDKTLPDSLRGKTNVIPLEENQELVSLLQDKIGSGQVSIALHGYHHTRDKNGDPEYLNGTDLDTKTAEGKTYLEELLQCSISTFVPPNNSIGANGLNAIIRNQLNLVGIPSLIKGRYRQPGLGKLTKHMQKKYYQLVHGTNYPNVMTVDGHKEVAYFPVTPSQSFQNLERGFDKMVSLDGIFIFATHYHAVDRKLKTGERIGDVLDLFLEKSAKLDNIEYCRYEELWMN